MKHKKHAFTLAEVLITLVIIGIIAAITVPSLINKTQNQEYVSKLKKAYSTLAQATNQIIAEEGPFASWNISTIEDVYNLYKKQLLNAKECGVNDNCFSQYHYKKLNGDIFFTSNTTSMGKLVLTDGVQILFGSLDKTCNWSPEGSKNSCFEIYVDLNGSKKPNIAGRDTFNFIMKNDGLYPRGCDVEGYCTKEYGGNACTCKVLREGAINY